MEPTAIGGKLASGLIVSLLKRLFPADGPGAGLVARPVRLGELVSFRGEKRTLGEKEIRGLATQWVRTALDAPGEPPFAQDERTAVTEALTRRLLALGDLDMDIVQAVRLGDGALARRLKEAAPQGDGLSADACLFLDGATEWACGQILEFFTRRSTFAARSAVEQSRAQARTAADVEELLARIPRPDTQDIDFEIRYAAYVAKKHGKLTIYGIDLSNSPGRWPLDAAYLSLEAVRRGGQPLDPTAGMAPAPPVAAPADEALAGHDRVLLRGVAGSGKTTLVQWLAVSAATEPTGRMAHLAGHVPFVLPLRTLTRHGERLPAPARFLAAVGCPLDGAQPAGWEYRVLTAGRGLLLVDGLDEVPEPERERARAWLRDLAEAFPGNRWLVTSRPSAVGDHWLADDGFTELALSAMSPSDVTSFIRRWHRAAATGAAEEDTRLAGYESQLLEAVRTKPDLGRLATNPLMCGLICALHRDRRGYLPHGRRELYESALSMLLTRRDRERDMTVPELSEEPQLQLLQRLAHWLIRNGRTEMDRDRAESIVAEVLPAVPAASALGDAAAVLDHFLVRTGLLLSPAPGTLHFVHRTFQDFLGARAAVEAGDLGLLAEHAADDQWADVIRMAVAQARPRERAELLGLLTSQSGKRAQLLAMACLEHATELDPAVRRQVEELARALLPPRTAEEAKELAEAGPLVLELLPGPEGLTDEEAEAVTATAALVGTDAAVPLLARFAGHPADRVRITLARAWERFDEAVYADDVLAGMNSDDFFLQVSSPGALRALPGLGRRPNLTIVGAHDLADIVAALPHGVEKLGLVQNPCLDDLRPLTAFPVLRRVTLVSCPGVDDVSALAGLGLEELSLHDIEEVSGFDQLTTLRALTVTSSITLDLLPLLPRNAPLTMLGLDDGAIGAGGLRGLSHWTTLNSVELRGEDAFLDARDWSELAALPALTRLSVPAHTAAYCVGAPELSGVELLHVVGVEGGEELSPLARMCPNARTVRLFPKQIMSLDEADYAAQFPGADVRVPPSRPYAF
ncbi:NACHT domain-containing protein [Streptomyces sp. 5-8]|uniref:NACHT domain-containing protein n=1 Tax=Streptomyces musisoli TaxID=2802280 RepID=A0ABS1P408_9ACTN|nr:NACHT domain-containing protein [Streptomyces musisoli]MBL1107104.1 NACHT domain-containing protein [Streptomyces musisoli]